MRADVDGIVIGEGFNPRTVEAFLTVLAEDSRFATCRSRCCPIFRPDPTPAGLPNLEHVNLAHVGGDPPPSWRASSRWCAARLGVAAAAPAHRAPSQGPARSAPGFTVTAFLRDLNRGRRRSQNPRQTHDGFPASHFPFDRRARANMDAARL